MRTGGLSFVGREAELEELRSGLAAAAAGRGGLWLLAGEPGIGKSRLAEELARAAPADAVLTLWGRCWEAGGAPACWPWVQALRGLLRGLPAAREAALAGGRAAHLLPLLPELRAAAPDLPDPPPLAPDQARFQLLDAVAGLLCDAAAATPLLIVLEDLHAADATSLLLLDFLGRQVRGSRIALLGTFRDAEATRGEAGALLLRIAHDARTLALRRLDRTDLARFLAEALGGPPSAALVADVHATTEGHPLFLVEVTRLLAAQGDAAASGARVAVPDSLRAAVRQRMAALSAEARAALALAAVAGREFEAATLARAFDADPAALERSFGEAAAAAVVLPVGRGTWRFTHILLRETIYEDGAPERRSGLHLRLAEALAEQAEGTPAAAGEAPWSAVAHHARRAGPPGLTLAVTACTRAAGEARARLAFDEAVAAWQTALAAHEASEAPDPAQGVELRLGLAGARLRAGAVAEGRATCRLAAGEARALGRPDLLARAALTYGDVFVFAHVDATLVGLLEEARVALPARDDPLLARVLARLAAARQPAAQPAGPIALAREAVAMARRLGDPAALLDVLRAACSAMMDLADPAQRLPFDREHVALAEARGDRAEALRGHTRLSVDCFELADVEGARRAVAAAARLAGELGHPFYRWRAAAFTATRALWEGRLTEAERAIEEAAALGARGGDPNAPRTAVLQRLRLLRLLGRTSELPAATAALGQVFQGSPQNDVTARVLAAAAVIPAGPAGEARSPGPPLTAEDVDVALAMGDRTLLEALCELAATARDESLARRLEPQLAPLAGRFVTGGVVGLTWDSPIARLQGLIAAARGRPAEAVAHFDEGLRQCLAVDGRPFAAWIACESAAVCAAADDPALRGRAATLLATADELAAACGMERLRARVAAARTGGREPGAGPTPRAPDGSPPAHAARAARAVRMERDGESWCLRSEGAPVRCADSKGMRYLATLLASPGRELHVLDLVRADSPPEPGGAPAPTAGDAGELLDAEARAAYRRRVAELRETIEEAEAWNDPTRAEKARAELEFIAAELARATGLGGRSRRAADDVERARVNVQRRLRDALRRIERQDADLGRYLGWTVRTGIFCAYEPG